MSFVNIVTVSTFQGVKKQNLSFIFHVLKTLKYSIFKVIFYLEQ